MVRRIPDFVFESDALFAGRLDHISGPGRNTVQLLAMMSFDDNLTTVKHFNKTQMNQPPRIVILNMNLYFRQMSNRWCPVGVRRQSQFPFSVFEFFVRTTFPVPTIYNNYNYLLQYLHGQFVGHLDSFGGCPTVYSDCRQNVHYRTATLQGQCDKIYLPQ